MCVFINTSGLDTYKVFRHILESADVFGQSVWFQSYYNQKLCPDNENVGLDVQELLSFLLHHRTRQLDQIKHMTFKQRISREPVPCQTALQHTASTSIKWNIARNKTDGFEGWFSVWFIFSWRRRIPEKQWFFLQGKHKFLFNLNLPYTAEKKLIMQSSFIKGKKNRYF